MKGGRERKEKKKGFWVFQCYREKNGGRGEERKKMEEKLNENILKIFSKENSFEWWAHGSFLLKSHGNGI